MPAFQDAFISYGRADSKAFVSALKEQLKARGQGQIWLDLDDIPAATDWQQRIDEAIGRSHQFIYVISPSAMASPYCKLELTLARQYGKRMIPLVHVPGDSNAWAIVDLEGSAAIRQLNWIFCREGIDNAEQAIETLYRTLSFADDPASQAYVHQHTTLLTQALSWEQHHRQTRYLLVGSDRQQAETWLQTRFAEGESAPCTPTDLHCEYITESTKNASNLMTQVFLCHSDQDQAPAEQIRRSLLRQGITVWNYRTDIQTSQDFHSAISQGIEEADNVVFLLSPHSAQSLYCQQELAQALALHKRVIPVLAAAVEPELVPEGLRHLQHIDLTDNTQASDYAADESQLLKQLNTDATYHTEHKTWLVQALKWQRQQQSPILLLRGYNLRRAETWLKVARTHRHPPTDLHEQFIAESLRQPPNPALDVFISYSRVDSDFARRLNDALQTQGKRTWFDQESIATGTDFQQEIYRGIESSDVFVFVLSPESVNSPFCADEVEYAQGLNKRMVTVLHRAIDVADLHPVLGKLQWLDFREHDGDFQANFAGLLRTLDTDREHLETHTRLLVRAGEWDRRGRDESLLLRGQDLETAEHWLATNAEVEPLPTGLQQEYIRAARARQEAQDAAEKKLRRGALIGALAAVAGIVVAAGSGWFAWNQQQKATASIKQADERIAQANARVTEADQKVDAATQQANAAIQQTQQAKRDQQQAETAAEEAAVAQQTAEARAREADGKAQTAAVSQQRAEASAQVADAKAQTADAKAREAATKTAEAEKAQRLAQTGTRLEQGGVAALRRSEFDQIGALLRALKIGGELETVVAEANIPLKAVSEYPAASPILTLQQLQANLSRSLLAHRNTVRSASFNATGDAVVTASGDGTARVWDLKTGQSTPLEGHTDAVNSASFNATGNGVVTASRDGTARVWDIKTGHSRPLEGHTNPVSSASFNTTGDAVVTASDDGTARVWDLKTGQVTPLEGHTDVVTSASFNATGDAVITTSRDGTARLWDLKTRQSTPLEGHTNSVFSARFNTTGDAVVTASGDGTARVWDLKTGQSTPLEGHTHPVSSASFNTTGDAVVTAGDGTARVWDLKSGQSIRLEGHTSFVTSASFNATGDAVVTASSDGTARVWNLKTGQSTPLQGHTSFVNSASFNATGDAVVTASRDGTARVWNLKTGQSTPLQGHTNPVTSASFNATGDAMVTTSEDSIARVWDLKTGQSTPLEGHTAGVTSASFNATGDAVVTASRDGTARLWDLKTGQSTPLEGHTAGVTSASFNATGDAVVTASYDGTARVWDPKTGQSTPLQGHTSFLTSASFNVTGDAVVTASNDGTARVWDLKTVTSTSLAGHTAIVTSTSFNAIGDAVVTASFDGTARVWDLKTGQSTPLEGHTSLIFSASFNTTGDAVVTASRDSTARVWDLKTGTSTPLEGHTDAVYSASFNASGDAVVTASADGTARVWDLKGRQLAIYEGYPVALSPDGQQLATVVDGRVQVQDIQTLPELLAWGCQWLHNYLEYGKATEADRAICNLPPRNPDPAGPFESSLGQAAGLVGVSWPGGGEG